MAMNVSGSSNAGIPNGCEKGAYSFSVCVCVLLVVIIMLHTGMILISDDTEADADDAYNEATSEL
ncbi:hypothetical protein NC652_040323 [Populus alba x Populus x berolinensis]|nr:hypothetical protein NC652_040323 [Populus alba x Populus x berolinensis]